MKRSILVKVGHRHIGICTYQIFSLSILFCNLYVVISELAIKSFTQFPRLKTNCHGPPSSNTFSYLPLRFLQVWCYSDSPRVGPPVLAQEGIKKYDSGPQLGLISLNVLWGNLLYDMKYITILEIENLRLPF